MYLNADGMCAECKVNGKEISVSINGYKTPLRVYGLGERIFYCGIAKPQGTVGRLCAVAPFKVREVLITDGRIEDSCREIFRFSFNEREYSVENSIPENPKNEFEKLLFSSDTVKACVCFFGHYVVFENSGITTYAFPSDFYTHPLPRFIPFSIWKNIDICGKNCGYYFISSDGKNPFFPNLKLIFPQNKWKECGQ